MEETPRERPLLSYRKMILFAFALPVGYNSGMKNDSEQQAAKQWEALAEWRREHPEAAADISLAIGAKARQQAALEERKRLLPVPNTITR